MKILVFSDSHGIIRDMINIVNKNLDSDMIIHLGDILDDVEYLENLFPMIKIEYVKGNNDFYYKAPLQKVIEVSNKKILITHGHNYSVKNSLDKLIESAKKMEVDLVLFGHTHVKKELFSGNIQLVNPGSISLAKYPEKNSYCILKIENDKIYSEFKIVNK